MKGRPSPSTARIKIGYHRLPLTGNTFVFREALAVLGPAARRTVRRKLGALFRGDSRTGVRGGAGGGRPSRVDGALTGPFASIAYVMCSIFY